MDIGPFIKEARLRAGLSQAQLAKRAGTSQPAVARLEQGGGNPSVETVAQLARAAGCELRIEIVPRPDARDAIIEAYKKDVDRTLIRENLKKSVNQRLRDMESFRKSASMIRASVAKGRSRG